jgi:predicted O-methyltransferase YrrM
MPHMTADRLDRTVSYIREVFGHEDHVLARVREAAGLRGFPDIAVSPEVGRLLMILASASPGGLALELGTLWGYSAIWIARGLGPRGRLVTVECEPAHADFAEEHFRTASLADRIEVRRGRALAVLPALASEVGPGSLGFVFIDAEKVEYPDCWRLVRPLIAPGGIVVVDNALGSGAWWIDEAGHPARDAVDRLNRTIAADEQFAAVAVPMRQGLLIARRMA